MCYCHHIHNMSMHEITCSTLLKEYHWKYELSAKAKKLKLNTLLLRKFQVPWLQSWQATRLSVGRLGTSWTSWGCWSEVAFIDKVYSPIYHSLSLYRQRNGGNKGLETLLLEIFGSISPFRAYSHKQDSPWFV